MDVLIEYFLFDVLFSQPFTIKLRYDNSRKLSINRK